MNLEVQVVGRNFPEIEPVLDFLNKNKIPHNFQVIEEFDAKTPVCYVGGYQHYGIENLEKIKDFYQLTLNKSR